MTAQQDDLNNQTNSVVDDSNRGMEISGPPLPATQSTTSSTVSNNQPTSTTVVQDDPVKSENVATDEKKDNPLAALAKKLSALKSELVEESPVQDEATPTTEVKNDSLVDSSQPDMVSEKPVVEDTPNIEQTPTLPEKSEVTTNPAVVDVSTTEQTSQSVSDPIPSSTDLPAQETQSGLGSEAALSNLDQIMPPSMTDTLTEVKETPVQQDGKVNTTDNLTDNSQQEVSTVQETDEVPGVDIAEVNTPVTPEENYVNTGPEALLEGVNTPTDQTQPIDPLASTLAGNDSGGDMSGVVDEGDKTAVTSEQVVARSVSGGKYPMTISKVLDIAIERNASDVHISVGYPVMIRVDGTLVAVNEHIVSAENSEELIMPVLSEQKKELLEVNREVDLGYNHTHGTNARFRINAYYTRQNLAAAFRLIPSRIKTIEELQLPPMYNQLANMKQGLVLITGPTGHGKSTTLAAILQAVNLNRAVHMVTIEDPVEYIFPKAKAVIDQREMHDDTHSWTIALKSALRQDPDVILVGEMRDYETIAATVTLAETGHLVFATLHTNSASQTVDRIIDVFPENQQAQIRTQLANILEAVIAQRLIPIEGGGRRAVSEILLGTPAIKNLIREGKTHQIDNVIRTSADVGMVSLEHSLVKLVREGLITSDKAQEYAVHPEEVVRLLKG